MYYYYYYQILLNIHPRSHLETSCYVPPQFFLISHIETIYIPSHRIHPSITACFDCHNTQNSMIP